MDEAILNRTNKRCPIVRRRNQLNKQIFVFRPYKIGCLSDPLREKSVKIPKARSGHRIVVDKKGNIYSCGGYSAEVDETMEDQDGFIWMHNCMLFKELWKFNIASWTWTKLKTSGSMPDEMASHAAVLLGSKLLVFGGTGVPFGESSSNSIHMCDLKTLTWTQLDTVGACPLEQYGQAIVLHDDKLYVVGGTTGFEYTMNVHCLNLETKEWSEIGAVSHPEPRYRHEIVMENGKLLVFGGGTDRESFSLKKIPVFDLKEKVWDKLSASSEHPAARRYHGCVRLDDDVYISGGLSGGRILSDIWKINLKSCVWKQLPCSLTVPLYFHSTAVSSEGQMFIFGGVTSVEENKRTNGLYSVWLKIPSLKEICWQAFLFYVPGIACVKKEKLLAAGIPMKFLDRVDFVDS